MRNRFIISESEKERILGLHEQFAGQGEMGDVTTNMMPPAKTNVVAPATTVNADIVKSLEAMKSTNPNYLSIINMGIKLLNSPTSPQISKTTTPDEILKIITPLFPDSTTLGLIKTAITNAIPGLQFPVIPVAGTPVATIQLGVENPKVKEIQNLLNGPKYNAKLVPDGKWGPKTATALQKAIATKKSAVVTPASVGDVSGTVATQTTVS